MQRETECADWMRRGIDGDEEAYRRLLVALGDTLRTTVRRRFVAVGLGNGDVEDVVQETLLALHLKRHTWKRTERIGPWVAAIVRNKLVDVVRRRVRHRLVPLDDIEESLFAQADQTEDARGDVDTMLDSLEVRQRTIVRMISIDGQSCRQAGAALAMTEVAVRVALHRALKSLAALYRAERS